MIRHAPSIGLGLGLSLRGSGGSGGVGFRGILDQYPGAAAAYSLRALSSGWLAGDVVEVRPSSGWTPASFTANQVANGDMVDYVKRCGDFTNDGYETFANNGTGDGFTATNTSGTGFARSSSVFGTTSDVVTIDFDLSIVSGSPSISLRAANTQRSNLVTYTTSGSKTATLTATGGFDNFTFSEGDVPSEFTISNVRVSANDGFVSTWYDQSGNGNNATQATTTAQPKIVSAGALVTGGIDFDGVDDGLATTGQVLTTSAFFMAAVMKHDTGTIGANGETVLGQYELSTAGRFQLSANASNEYSFFANGTDSIVGLSTGAVGTSQTLISTNGDGSNAEIWRDSVSKATDTYSGFTPAMLDFTIGIDSSGQREFNGKIAEVIVYPSDQSANRVAIETNIQDAYPALP